MKFLISNYSNPWYTEPYYFNAGLNLIDGASSSIVNPQISIYDNFDSVKPDVFVTHLSQISKDVISYLRDNKNIKLVVNTNWIDDNSINNAASFISEQGITPTFFGNDDRTINSLQYIKILYGADTFLQSPSPEYSIQKLIFVTSNDQIVELDGTYHYATINQDISKEVDFFVHITMLNSLFPNYKEIIFKSSSYIGTQLAFNAIYSGVKVVFDTKDPKDLDKIDSLFKGQKLLSSVKTKHTGLHRLKSLLSQISCQDLSTKLDEKI